MSRLTINMSALDKVECCFGERTVLDLYGDSCDVNHLTFMRCEPFDFIPTFGRSRDLLRQPADLAHVEPHLLLLY